MKHLGEHGFRTHNPQFDPTGDDYFPVHRVTADPTATDDADDGYEEGHYWHRTDTDDLWILKDDTVGAAIWTPLTRVEVVLDTTTARTLDITDCNTIVEFNNAGAITVTFPQDSDEDIPIGRVGFLSPLAAGAITCAAGTGAALKSRGNLVASNGQDALICWVKKAANTFLLSGDLA